MATDYSSSPSNGNGSEQSSKPQATDGAGGDEGMAKAEEIDVGAEADAARPQRRVGVVRDDLLVGGAGDGVDGHGSSPAPVAIPGPRILDRPDPGRT